MSAELRLMQLFALLDVLSVAGSAKQAKEECGSGYLD